jgi:hypothetical protein
MKSFALSDFTMAIELIMRHNFKSVTVFCPPLKNVVQRVRVCRPYPVRKGARINELRLTYGRPNYREREFLKQCKKANCLPRKWKAW